MRPQKARPGPARAAQLGWFLCPKKLSTGWLLLVALCQKARFLATLPDPLVTPAAAPEAPTDDVGLGVRRWAIDPPYSFLKGIFAQSCFLPALLSARKLDEKGPSEIHLPHTWLVVGKGSTVSYLYPIKAPPTSTLYDLVHPCLPQDTHSPHAWPHPLGRQAPQPSYEQTPEGHCQQHACQWPSRQPRALVYGPWGHP